MKEKNNHEKAEMYDRFIELEKDAAATLERVEELRGAFEKVVKENNSLAIENQNLRDRLEELQQKPKKESVEPELSRSRQNLEKLYEDGFHVCNMFFGSRRVEDESCAFCLNVIYGERN